MTEPTYRADIGVGDAAVYDFMQRRRADIAAVLEVLPSTLKRGGKRLEASVAVSIMRCIGHGLAKTEAEAVAHLRRTFGAFVRGPRSTGQFAVSPLRWLEEDCWRDPVEAWTGGEEFDAEEGGSLTVADLREAGRVIESVPMSVRQEMGRRGISGFDAIRRIGWKSGMDRDEAARKIAAFVTGRPGWTERDEANEAHRRLEDRMRAYREKAGAVG